ncbi:MAG: winged helix-turn-helix domain-containing protein [Solirubrobacterales bacterium]|nr:winged helix-turn-helix domain-containing protein [Solirubrobacterales bacterium]
MSRRTLQSKLDQRAGALIGRERERAALLDLVERDTPLVAVVHGIAGVGKSTLLHAAAVDARVRGALVVALDGRAFEPTERGFVTSLGTALGTHVTTIAEATDALASDVRVLLAIDTYEQLRLLDAWLRQTFVPALPHNVRLVLAGRDTPSAWQRELGDLLRAIRLDNLSDKAAQTLLRRAGVEDAVAERVARVARGHPLSLQLAAGALAERPGLPAADAVFGTIVEELARLYIDGLDPMTRRALEAAAVIRRTTLSLLEAMLPEDDPSELFAALRALAFVELGADGLVVHDTVRVAASALLQASDPARHRAHRRAAWTRLRAELRTAGRADLWRYTADMLYLVENPIVRDAFFPSDTDELTIEPAGAADREAITALSAAQEGSEATALVDAWWRSAPDAFRVVRDAAGVVRGFSSLCQPRDVSRSLLRNDPVTAAWMEHLRRDPVPSGQRVLFNRHALSVGDSARARLWLDVKRVYLELRPHLRRLYLPVRDVDEALTVLAPLGFAALPGAPVQIGEHAYWTLLNDFGPGSIDGWLSEVVGRELAADEPTVLDAEARRLVLDGQAVDLSRLELEVLRHLQRRQGIAVAREELLREVWGHHWTGANSNVVEAVVSGLRRKMGDHAGALETVRGIGYRLGPLN